MKKTIQEHRAEAVLNKVMRYPEGIMSRKEWLNYWRIKGATVKENKVRNYAAEEKLRNHLDAMRHNIPMGNPNYPATKKYLEDKETLKQGIFKIEYGLYLPDGCSYDITKTEYDYFNNMALAEDKATEANETAYKIEAGTATEEEESEYMEKDFEFFRKYAQ